MPVRKIPKNYLSVTGDFSSRKNGRSLGYESLLERDLMILLEFDDAVEGFEEQPVKIPFKVSGRARSTYVPDILISYKPTQPDEPGRKVLGEVKTSEDLKKNKVKYAPKFEAAESYAKERGWEWRKFTEKEIRTPYLDNLKFLRESSEADPLDEYLSEVKVCVGDLHGKATIGKVLEDLCPTDDRILYIAPALWRLLFTKVIHADLTKPLSMKTKLALSE